MNPSKLLLILLLLLGVGAGLYFGLADDDGVPVVETPIEPQAPTPPVVTPAVEPAQPTTPTPQEPREQQGGGRVEVRTPSDSNLDMPQGIKGRVVLPGGAPAPEIDVYLLRSSTADALSIYLDRRRGKKTEPIAHVMTGADGHFAIGMPKPGETVDLRVVSPMHPEIHHKSVKIRTEDWYDTGNLELQVGSIVQGRVVDETGKFPVASATVYLTQPNLNHQMLPTPGRERGIVTSADSNGFFRFENAPRDAVVNLGAESPDYAYSERQNLHVKADTQNEFTIELARGQPIVGVVVDVTGKPIAGATVLATAQSAKVPQVGTTMSSTDGRFELPLLRPGPYQLTAMAPNFEDVIEKPIFAGDDEVRLVLEQRGRVKLRVFSYRGQPIKEFTVGLKRYFPNNPGQIGKVAEFRDQRITPKDFEGDYAIIHNVPNGEFVFQVLEGEHAKTLSPNFTMAVGAEPPTVEVTLTMGAAITGRVVDDRGAPVSGATIVTDMNGGLAIDSGFLDMFRGFLPDKHTTSSTKSNAAGEFRLNRLAFADYMIKVSHPDFCEGAVLEIKLDKEGQSYDAGTISLQRGAVLSGTCRLGGRATGQIKVSIGPPNGYQPKLDANGKPVGMMFTANVITDGDGNYRFTKRVPPGTYKIYAFKEAGSDDVFGRLKHMKETERQLIVGAGQQEAVENFDLSQ